MGPPFGTHVRLTPSCGRVAPLECGEETSERGSDRGGLEEGGAEDGDHAASFASTAGAPQCGHGVENVGDGGFECRSPPHGHS
jgi:hypothetical protein